MWRSGTRSLLLGLVLLSSLAYSQEPPTLRHLYLGIRNSGLHRNGFDNPGLGGGTANRAEIVAPISYPKTRFQWFSTSSFAQPAAFQWGTAARNDVVGPGINNWNIAMYKTFQFSERARFEFRGETFNTFNHTQFTGLQTSLT